MFSFYVTRIGAGEVKKVALNGESLLGSGGSRGKPLGETVAWNMVLQLGAQCIPIHRGLSYLYLSQFGRPVAVQKLLEEVEDVRKISGQVLLVLARLGRSGCSLLQCVVTLVFTVLVCSMMF